MKFATKLSLGCITLLSCALCAAGLILTGKSFQLRNLKHLLD